MEIRQLKFPARIAIVLIAAAAASSGQALPKGAIAEKIRRVEDSVDEFKNYLERRGENARNTANTAQQSGRTPRRTAKANPEARQEAAKRGKDELDDALGELNSSTNRLRRKFDATDTWMETKPQVERVVDDGRRINQAVARGNYGSEVARLWAALRTQINDLARAYNVAPLGM